MLTALCHRIRIARMQHTPGYYIDTSRCMVAGEVRMLLLIIVIPHQASLRRNRPGRLASKRDLSRTKLASGCEDWTRYKPSIISTNDATAKTSRIITVKSILPEPKVARVVAAARRHSSRVFCLRQFNMVKPNPSFTHRDRQYWIENIHLQ